jgi:hypothetical protein
MFFLVQNPGDALCDHVGLKGWGKRDGEAPLPGQSADL